MHELDVCVCMFRNRKLTTSSIALREETVVLFERALCTIPEKHIKIDPPVCVCVCGGRNNTQKTCSAGRRKQSWRASMKKQPRKGMKRSKKNCPDEGPISKLEALPINDTAPPLVDD